MKKVFATLAALFFVTAAYGQNAGSITNHAFAIGKGPGTNGFTSLLCGSAQLAVGQAAANPICRTISGDVTLSAAGAITLATVNANVGSFGSATQCTSVTVNAKGLITAASQATCTPAVGSITGLGANVATWLGTPSSVNLRAALTDETGTGLAYFQGGDIGTPSAGVGSNLTALNASQLTLGTVPAARMPALTGDCTTTIGTVVTTCTGINGVNLNTAWATWVPTVSCGAGTFTTLGTVVARQKTIGKIVIAYISIPITTNGTCATYVQATLPTASANTSTQSCIGRANGSSGKSLGARILINSTTLQMTNYDNTYPGANGEVLDVTCTYEVP